MLRDVQPHGFFNRTDSEPYGNIDQFSQSPGSGEGKGPNGSNASQLLENQHTIAEKQTISASRINSYAGENAGG
jgi:hypothetical protein